MCFMCNYNKTIYDAIVNPFMSIIWKEDDNYTLLFNIIYEITSDDYNDIIHISESMYNEYKDSISNINDIQNRINNTDYDLITRYIITLLIWFLFNSLDIPIIPSNISLGYNANDMSICV